MKMLKSSIWTLSCVFVVKLWHGWPLRLWNHRITLVTVFQLGWTTRYDSYVKYDMCIREKYMISLNESQVSMYNFYGLVNRFSLSRVLNVLLVFLVKRKEIELLSDSVNRLLNTYTFSWMRKNVSVTSDGNGFINDRLHSGRHSFYVVDLFLYLQEEMENVIFEVLHKFYE